VDAANTGQWRPPRNLLLQPPRLTSWAVVNLAGSGCSSGISAFVSLLQETIKQQRGQASKPAVIDGTQQSSIASAMQAAVASCAGKPQLLLVVLSAEGKTYLEVKAGAAGLGVKTQCMVARKAGITGRDNNIKQPYVNNILLKIASKLGSLNWQLVGFPDVCTSVFSKQMMVLGIDVSHGAAGGAGKRPSFAAVVGSVDTSCCQYAAAVMQQTAGHEIVLGTREAVSQLLQQYQQSQGLLPQSLLVFRDGVSDSQHVAVLQQEVEAVRQACRDVGGDTCRPKVSAGRPTHVINYTTSYNTRRAMSVGIRY